MTRRYCFYFLGTVTTQGRAQVSPTIYKRNTFLFRHLCTCACIANVNNALAKQTKQIEAKECKHKNKNFFFLVKRCSSKCKLKVTVSSGNQRRRKHMHKWDALFTPLKLAQVIWPQPRTQGLSPSPLTTMEGKERNAGYEVDLARH